MMKFVNLRLLFFASLLGLGFASCTSDDNSAPPPDTSISDILAASPNLTSLYAAVERAELVDELNASGNLTLLAPTNTAFDLFLINANFASLEDVPVEVLKQLLLNHVIGARIDANTLASLGKNYTATLADGNAAGTNLSLFFDATGGEIIFNGVAEVVDADIAANNGVIHVVDGVLDLPTIATFVTANDGFEDLTLALTTATPDTDFIALLSGNGPFTLFAPANLAFDALLDTNPSWDSVDDIDEAELTAILEHHIVNVNLQADDVDDDETAETREGDNITFSTADGQLDLTDGSGNEGITVIVADIQAINGVLHAVDEVLLPDTTN